jgi:hypothetical protein
MGFPTIGQETCRVEQRHEIIERVPNLVPTYYQVLIFDKILAKTGVRGIKFKPSRVELPSAFSYGISEVDSLPSGSQRERIICQE